MSESQERMMAVVPPDQLDAFMADHRQVGRRGRPWSARSPTPAGSSSTGTARASSTCRRAPSRTRARSTTARTRARLRWTPCRPTSRRHGWRGRRRATSSAPPLLRLAASPNLARKAWVTDQYDRYVMGNTALAMPDDAGRGPGRRGDRARRRASRPTATAGSRELDPYTGAQLALAEAYRNVATAGAVPLAVTDCLNFGSPEDPGVMWQFAAGRPRSGRRLPGARGPGHRRQRQPLQPDRRRSRSTRPRWSACSACWTTSPAARRRAGGRRPGHLPAGHHPRRAVGGSAWADVVHGHLGGLPPARRPRRRAAARRGAGRRRRDGLVDAAHDLSDGGLAQALVESCLRYGVGARVWLDELCERDGVDAVRGAVLASRRPGCSSRCRARRRCASPTCAPPAASRTCGSGWWTTHRRRRAQSLDVQGLFRLGLDDLREAWTAPLRERFGAWAALSPRRTPHQDGDGVRGLVALLVEPRAGVDNSDTRSAVAPRFSGVGTGRGSDRQ